MRLVVTGVDGEGRSTVIREDNAVFASSPPRDGVQGRTALSRVWLHEGGPLDTVSSVANESFSQFNLPIGAAKWAPAPRSASSLEEWLKRIPDFSIAPGWEPHY